MKTMNGTINMNLNSDCLKRKLNDGNRVSVILISMVFNNSNGFTKYILKTLMGYAKLIFFTLMLLNS